MSLFLEGFKVLFKPPYLNRDADRTSLIKVKIKGPNVTEFTIKDLEVFTQYLVSLEVENPEGAGPATTVVVMTDEGGKGCKS